MLRDDPDRPKAARERAPAAPAPASAGRARLFQALRQWRAAEAERQSVPPYVIFHDSVLREVAAARPGGMTALGAMRGVGASKLDATARRCSRHSPERPGEGPIGSRVGQD